LIVLEGHPFEWEVAGPTAVTVGVFDGVHMGHRRVLSDLVSNAVKSDLIPVVVTFDPHPLAIIAPEKAPLLLTNVRQRIEQFRLLGVDVAGILWFPDIRELGPAEFVEQVVAEALQARRVVVGADFRFGRDRGGDATFLAAEGSNLGFDVQIVDMFGHEDGVISSTRIRHLLEEGKVDEAAALLGRPYELEGVVVKGDRRGVTGFPTANIEVAPSQQVPGNGVYAAMAQIDGRSWPAVINVGVRPTFDATGRTIEVHLLNFEGDLYGTNLAASFVSRLRDERRFENVDALKEQIGRDIDRARETLSAWDGE
jgi:riboflavin kinase/FMN adenylyltransferase